MSDRWGIRPPIVDPFDYQGSSFSELVRRMAPPVAAHPAGGTLPPHVEGTTIVATTYNGGVILAGDRRATAGNLIAQRDVRKIFETDQTSAVGISGSAGPSIELAKVFALELEHYEKVEGSELSLEGKANKLASMVRGNLPLAMQGLVVVPMFAGYDRRAEMGRIFDFDVAGGRYEERRFSATGSGGLHARASLKARWDPNLEQEEAVALAVAALWDAADDDAATGGPDTVRGVYPIVAQIDADGYAERTEQEVAELSRMVAERRSDRLAVGGAISSQEPRPNAGA